MYIEYQLPQNSIQGEVTAYNEDGEEVQVSRIVYTPFFFTPGSIPVVLYTSLFLGAAPVERDSIGKVVVQRSVLTVSGATCRLRFQDRTEHVTPLCEDSKAKKETASGTAPRKSSQG